MLVLGRKTGEHILVGEEIEIHVVRIRSGRISIGIKAPREVAIRRGELLDQLLGAANGELEQSMSEDHLTS